MRSNKAMIHKLQQAINGRGERILYEKSQFYSESQQRPISQYKIMKSIPPEAEGGRNKKIELFSAYSQIQIVLFLRDYWYHLNDWEIPTDNEMWEEAKEKYYADHTNALRLF